MPIQFTNQETASQYETDFENDVVLSVNCPCNGNRGYSGKLSNIPPEAAATLIEQKSNLVRLKAATTKPAEKPKASLN